MSDGTWKKSEQILEQKIARTTSLIRRVDAVSAFFASASAALLLLLAGIILDHLFLHGLSKHARILYAVSAGIGLFLFTFFRFLPLFRYRINRLYSAELLEKSVPQLKSGLINWLFLKKAQKKESDPAVRDFTHKLSIQTAKIIPNGAEEEAVDTAPILRWGIVFIVSAALLAGYTVFSKKSPFPSAARIILPVSNIEAPQSVTFRKIEPGNSSLYFGKTVLVRAEIAGAGDTPIFVSYSTADGRITDKKILMESKGFGTGELLFPPDPEGLTEPLDYRIVLGEEGKEKGFSPIYRLDVKPAISFTPVRLEYRYPSYTGLSPVQIENQGDIKAPEGTEVTITAEGNIPLVHPLFVPDFTITRAETMSVSTANPQLASLTLTLKSRNGEPEIGTYQLSCSDTEKNLNIESPNDPENGAPFWKVELTSDPAPLLRWKNLPAENEELTIPENQRMNLEFEAEDEEYGLTKLRLEILPAETQGENSLQEPIASEDYSGEIAQSENKKKFSVSYEFYPYQFEPKLEEGAVVECRLFAEDNRQPNPNEAESEPLRIRITKTELNIPGTEQKKPDEEKEESGESGNQGTGSQNSKNGESENSSGDQGEKAKTGNSESGESDSEKEEGESGQSGEKSGENSGTPDGSEDSDLTETGQGESEGTDTGGENGKQNQNSDSESSRETEGQSGSEQKRTDNGSSTDSSGGGTPEEGENRSGKSGSASGEPKEGENETGGTGGNTDPLDPETDPGSVFEAILDFSGLDVETAPASGDPAGLGTGVSSPDNQKKNSSNSDIDSADLKSGSGTADPNANRKTDPNPNEIPQDSGRENGEVDPNTNNYMATAGQSSGTGKTPPANANVTLDPNLNTETRSSGETGTSQTGPELPPEAGGETGTENNGNANPRTGDGAAEGTPAEDSGDDPSDAPPVDMPFDQTPNAGEGDNAETGLPNSKQGEKWSNPNAEKRQVGSGAGTSFSESDSKQAAADRAHLEYTEKATALALAYLEDQIEKNPDPALLNRLGWTVDELREFHRLWKEMQTRAGTIPADSAERRQYNETLLDMGIRPPQNSLHAGPRKDNRTESGTRQVRRSVPPAEYSERFRIYNERISKK